MAQRRVVITGLGAVSPVGNNVKASWENIKAGNSGVDKITLFDASDYPVQIAAEVKDFDLYFTISMYSSSFNIVIPSSLALSYLLPGFSPTIT